MKNIRNLLKSWSLNEEEVPSNLPNREGLKAELMSHPERPPGIYHFPEPDGTHTVVAHGWDKKPLSIFKVNQDKGYKEMVDAKGERSDAIGLEGHYFSHKNPRSDSDENLSTGFLPTSMLHAYNKISNNKKFQRLTGVTPDAPTELLGKGSFGFAVSAPNGKAFKVTKDRSEAHMSSNIRNNPIPNVWKPDNVFYHPQTNKYIIHGDQLTKDLGRARSAYYVLDDALHNDPRSSYLYTDEAMKNLHADHAAGRLSDDAMKLAKAMHTINKRGMKFGDMHPGNIMFDAQGEPTIIDLGLSDSPYAHIDSLEEKRIKSRD